MQHPFAGILDENGTPLSTPTGESTPSRRDCLKSALQVGTGVVVGGLVGSAEAAPTKAAPNHPEHGGALPAVTRAGPGHPEHGGAHNKPKHPTKAGKGVEDGDGKTKLAAVDAELNSIQTLIKQGEWVEAGVRLNPLRGLKAGAEGSKAANQHSRREKLEKHVSAQAKTALETADKQAKAGELVPALTTYRQAASLGDGYGVQEKAQRAVAALAKQPGYPEALEKVKAIEKMKSDPPQVTTFAVGEEGGQVPPRPSTRAAGEEGGRPPGRITTKAIGEEGGRPRPPGPDPRPTTLAIGEEG